MATQGLISIVEKGRVVMKIVAGSEGYNAKKLAKEIKKRWPISPLEALEMADENTFGHREIDLVVISESEIIFEGEDEPGPLYHSTFHDPKFNPRWLCGLADHVLILSIDGSTVE